MQAGNRRPAGRGDLVFELRRMTTQIARHFRGTENGLGGQALRHVAGKAAFDAAVGQRFDEDEDVGGAAAGETGHRIE